MNFFDRIRDLGYKSIQIQSVLTSVPMWQQNWGFQAASTRQLPDGKLRSVHLCICVVRIRYNYDNQMDLLEYGLQQMTYIFPVHRESSTSHTDNGPLPSLVAPLTLQNSRMSTPLGKPTPRSQNRNVVIVDI
jgi:hypothetical protein